METIINIIKTVSQNWDQVLLAVTSLVTFASIVVKLTPSSKDDKIVMKIVNFLSLARGKGK